MALPIAENQGLEFKYPSNFGGVVNKYISSGMTPIQPTPLKPKIDLSKPITLNKQQPIAEPMVQDNIPVIEKGGSTKLGKYRKDISLEDEQGIINFVNKKYKSLKPEEKEKIADKLADKLVIKLQGESKSLQPAKVDETKKEEKSLLEKGKEIIKEDIPGVLTTVGGGILGALGLNAYLKKDLKPLTPETELPKTKPEIKSDKIRQQIVNFTEDELNPNKQTFSDRQAINQFDEMANELKGKKGLTFQNMYEYLDNKTQNIINQKDNLIKELDKLVDEGKVQRIKNTNIKDLLDDIFDASTNIKEKAIPGKYWEYLTNLDKLKNTHDKIGLKPSEVENIKQLLSDFKSAWKKSGEPKEGINPEKTQDMYSEIKKLMEEQAGPKGKELKAINEKIAGNYKLTDKMFKQVFKEMNIPDEQTNKILASIGEFIDKRIPFRDWKISNLLGVNEKQLQKVQRKLPKLLEQYTKAEPQKLTKELQKLLPNTNKGLKKAGELAKKGLGTKLRIVPVELLPVAMSYIPGTIGKSFTEYLETSPTAMALEGISFLSMSDDEKKEYKQQVEDEFKKYIFDNYKNFKEKDIEEINKALETAGYKWAIR